RCQNQFRAGGRETLISAQDFLKIAAQISDRRINLSKTNLHAAHGRLCATQPAAILFSLLSLAPRDDVALLYPVGYPPDGPVAVFAEKEAAIFRDRDSDGSAPNVTFGRDEAGNEIFILADCFAGGVIKWHAYNLVSGAFLPVP